MENLINKIIHADCLDILKQLPDKSVDLVLTDPPYGKEINGVKIERTGGSWSNNTLCKKIKDWDERPSQEIFGEIFRVSKNQIIWGGNYFCLPPTRCFNVWKKLTIGEKFSMAMAEFAWTSFNTNAKLWEFAPQDPSRFHPTQKPVKLIEKQLIEYTKENDLILDCFSGSGTTAIACHNLKRRFICIEKDFDYFKASVERLEQHQRQLSLF